MSGIRAPLLCALLFLAAPARAAPAVEADLGDLLRAMPGHYAGLAPKAFQPDGTMEKLVHSFIPIEAPQFGKTVVYYQISAEEADGKVLQAKIFVFDTDSMRAANTMRAFILDPAQAGAALYQSPARLAALKPAELMSFPAECFFTWRRLEDGFEGKGSENCSYPSRAFKQTITPRMTYRIHSDRFEMSEALYGEDGRAIVSTNGIVTARRE
jgi:hypothetical protein